MPTAIRTMLVSFLLLLSSACVTATRVPMRGDGEVTLHRAHDATPQPAIKAASIERYDSFALSVIEFTDRGELAEPNQATQAEALIRATLDRQKDALFVLFVHGWGHSADTPDENLADFRKVLEGLPKIEGIGGREIVGIYVGWRGTSLNKPFHWGTFADRSSAADRIGKEKKARDVLRRLSDLIAEAQTSTRNVTAVAVGHSLGGKLLFSPMESDLEAETAQARVAPESLPIFGSVAILVNPAQDVHDYEVFERYAKNHAGAPLRVLIVSSEADRVVGFGFRLGRTLKNVINPRTWRNFNGERIGLGWRASQITHVLCSTAPGGAPPSKLCDGSMLGKKVVEDANTALYVREGVDPAGPFRLVRADRRLIANHGDFFNERFATFLQGVIAQAARNSGAKEDEARYGSD